MAATYIAEFLKNRHILLAAKNNSGLKYGGFFEIRHILAAIFLSPKVS